MSEDLEKSKDKSAEDFVAPETGGEEETEWKPESTEYGKIFYKEVKDLPSISNVEIGHKDEVCVYECKRKNDQGIEETGKHITHKQYKNIYETLDVYSTKSYPDKLGYGEVADHYFVYPNGDSTIVTEMVYPVLEMRSDKSELELGNSPIKYEQNILRAGEEESLIVRDDESFMKKALDIREALMDGIKKMTSIDKSRPEQFQKILDIMIEDDSSVVK